MDELGKMSSGDEDLAEELLSGYSLLEKKISDEEYKILLAGPYDKRNAILEIFAGAGGEDAQDWAKMLLRMYQRYCQKRGWQTKFLNQDFGQGISGGEPGIREATLAIKGDFTYGILKGETGVHRLVRISPFSSQKLRHTSFARVQVLPEIMEPADLQIKINPSDLKIDTFHASGPGGQYVNKRESAIRITHLPSGISVSCQSERLQGMNRERAMKVLYSRLFEAQKENLEQTKAKIKGKEVPASWGYQVRSYILHPYKMVKDLRTGVETSEADSVLDGDLGIFIEAAIRSNAGLKIKGAK